MSASTSASDTTTKQLRALRRMLPTGMIRKQLHPRGARVPQQYCYPPSTVHPRLKPFQVGLGDVTQTPEPISTDDPESSDERQSVIRVSFSGRSISDVKELLTFSHVSQYFGLVSRLFQRIKRLR